MLVLANSILAPRSQIHVDTRPLVLKEAGKGSLIFLLHVHLGKNTENTRGVIHQLNCFDKFKLKTVVGRRHMLQSLGGLR